MVYGSFWILIWRWEPSIVFAFYWGCVFVIKMLIKDYRLSMKEGWEEYKAKTWWVIPKLYNSAILSVLTYGVLAVAGFLCYKKGGIEASTKLLIK